MARAKKKPVIEMDVDEENVTRDDALETLGLSGAVSDDDVRAAFRARLKAAHPDIQGGTDVLLRRLIMARELLISNKSNITEATELLQNFSKPIDQSIRLEITLSQAIFGGEAEHDVPALEVSAPHEELTSLTQLKTLRIPLAPGLRNGDTVSVATEGPYPQKVFRICIDAGDGMRVWGDDIWMTARIEARIFALGGLARIETPYGPHDVAIEKDAPRGSSLCLKGLGLPATERSKAGDLHVRLEASVERGMPYSEALEAFRMKWAS